MPAKEKSKSQASGAARPMYQSPAPAAPAPAQDQASAMGKYDDAAEYHYYDTMLRQALRDKNPEMFDFYVSEIAKMRQAGPEQGNRWDTQQAIPQGYEGLTLSPDEIKSVLGAAKPLNTGDPYQRFMELRKRPGLGGFDYGYMQRQDYSDYSPRDLSVEKVMSFVDGNKYYKAEVKNGKLERKTNMLGLAGALK